MFNSGREDLSKVLSYQIKKDNHIGISHAIREGDKPVNCGHVLKRSLSSAICNGCRPDSIKALIEGGAEIKKGYNFADDDLILLLNSELYGAPHLRFTVEPDKIKVLLDNGAKIVDDVSPLKEKIITNIHQREIEPHFNELNRYPVTFLKDFNPELGDHRMISNIIRLQDNNESSLYILIRDFFVHRMHDEVRNREDNRDWKVKIATFIEKDRVIALQSYFKYHLTDQHFDYSEIFKTTLNHLFLEKDLIKNIRGVISSAQLLIEHNPRSVISNDIKAQLIFIKENELLLEQIDDSVMFPTDTYHKYDPHNQLSLCCSSLSSVLYRKHTFSTAYQIVKLVAYQIMYHKNDQDNKIEIASLIEQAIKCGLKESEIFEAISQFYQDYELKQQIHIQEQFANQLDSYQRHQEINNMLVQQVDIGEFGYDLKAIRALPSLNHSELLNYVTECISNIGYKEGAVIGLFQNANTDGNPKTVNWENLSTEVCVMISKCLNIKDAGRASQTCKNAYEVAKKVKETKLNALSTKMAEAQLQSLDIASPSRQ